MQKIIIGLAGQKVAGKGLFVEFLSEAARKRNLTVQQFKSSDILTEMLNIVGIVAERANLQTLASLLVSGFGNGVISEAVRVKMEKSPADIVIFDGVRWLSDVQMIKQFPGGKLVFIKATKTIRYGRLRNRGEKPEEKNLSFSQFEAEEEAPTENFIPKIKEIADFVFTNNESKKSFQEKTDYFLKDEISGN